MGSLENEDTEMDVENPVGDRAGSMCFSTTSFCATTNNYEKP